jgi:hypothetical protein
LVLAIIVLSPCQFWNKHWSCGANTKSSCNKTWAELKMLTSVWMLSNHWPISCHHISLSVKILWYLVDWQSLVHYWVHFKYYTEYVFQIWNNDWIPTQPLPFWHTKSRLYFSMIF